MKRKENSSSKRICSFGQYIIMLFVLSCWISFLSQQHWYSFSISRPWRIRYDMLMISNSLTSALYLIGADCKKKNICVHRIFTVLYVQGFFIAKSFMAFISTKNVCMQKCPCFEFLSPISTSFVRNMKLLAVQKRQ